MTTKRGYTTYGSVRGGCGKLYRTESGAEKALQCDRKGCQSQGGYSDRVVVIVGDDGYLYYDEDCTDWVPGEEGRSCGVARF